MPLIGYAIGNLSEHIIISEIYKPNDFQAGWYFIPHNFPSYQFISTDFNPDIDEIVQDGDKFNIYGFDPYLEKMNFPDDKPLPIKREFTKNTFEHYPSGVPYNYEVDYYWEIYGDINSPYLFIPFFNPDTYGKIVWMDFNSPLERFEEHLLLVEQVLNGLVFPFVQKIVQDASWQLPLKEKIVSLLSCDIRMISPNTLKLTWDGERVPFIEVLRKEISDNNFGEPIAVVPFEEKEFIFEIDNNSYIYSVRGSHGTGMSNVEVTIGVRGLTTINSEINLGDFVKIYEGDIDIVDRFETEIYI